MGEWRSIKFRNRHTEHQHRTGMLKILWQRLGQMGKRGDHPWSPLNASKSSSNSGWVFFQKRCLFYEKKSWNLSFSCDFAWCLRWTLITSPYLVSYLMSWLIYKYAFQIHCEFFQDGNWFYTNNANWECLSSHYVLDLLTNNSVSYVLYLFPPPFYIGGNWGSWTYPRAFSTWVTEPRLLT